MISARSVALLGLVAPLSPTAIAVLGFWPEQEDDTASPPAAWTIPALPLEEARLGVYYRNRLRLSERWLEIHASTDPAPGAGGVQ